MLTRIICICLVLALNGLAQTEDPIQQSKALTADGAAELERSLATNSQDVAARLTLMWYYAAHNSLDSHLSQFRHIEWMIENHPDSELFQGEDAKLQPFFGAPAFRAKLDHAKDLWLRAALASHDDPRVLNNAQNSLHWVDPAACIGYILRLRRAEPANPKWVIAVLRVYSRIIYEDPKMAKNIAETDIEPSNDLAVTGCVGQLLFGIGSSLTKSADFYEFASVGEKLLRKAQKQDPTSWRWERTLAVLPGMMTFHPAFNSAARAGYVANWIINSLRQEDLWPSGKVPGLPLPAGAVRGNSLNLSIAPIPINSPMPKGDTSVRLEIVIGRDGRVEKAQYVAGLAALGDEAVRAALQWKFPPQFEEGKAAKVLVQIDDSVRRAPYVPVAKFSPVIPGGFGSPIGGGGVIAGIVGGLPGPPPPFIDADLIAAQLVHRVEPVYPAAARNSGVAGTVRFRATLGPDGAVSSLELVSGQPMLVNAARRAVSRWLYNPWIAEGKQVEVSTTIDVEVK